MRFTKQKSVNQFRKDNNLLRYEASMPPKFDGHVTIPILCKTFCLYHRSDFNRLAEPEKELLFDHHHKNLVITESDIEHHLPSLTI